MTYRLLVSLLGLCLVLRSSGKALDETQIVRSLVLGEERGVEDCEENPNCPVLAKNFGCDDPRGMVKDMCKCSCGSSGAVVVQEKDLEISENETGANEEKKEKREESEEQLFLHTRNGGSCQGQENPNCEYLVGGFGCDDPRGLMKVICSCTCAKIVPEDNTNGEYYDDNMSDNSFGMSEEEDIMLTEHNLYRRRHGVPDLTYDRDLARASSSWCDTLATTNTFEHSDQSEVEGGYGENLYYSYGMPLDKVPAKAVKVWYDEIELYDFSNPGFSFPTGHFTALIWRDTKKVGCAVTDPSINVQKKSYACCQYLPPGNWQGEFEENVPPPNDF